MKVNSETDWYLYQYLVDSEIKIADPYAELILDPWNDEEINNNYFPDYPDNKTTAFVTAFKLNGHDFQWTDDNFQKPAPADLIIYELLLRDFFSEPFLC